MTLHEVQAAIVVGGWALVTWAVYGRPRRVRGPVDYGPLPVPLVAAAVVDPWVALLAVDAAVWSYADAIGASRD